MKFSLQELLPVILELVLKLRLPSYGKTENFNPTSAVCDKRVRDTKICILFFADLLCVINACDLKFTLQ